MDIDGYFKLNYHKLLVVISAYYISGCWWLLMIISAYSINGYC